MTLVRCPWCGTDPLYVAYHDHEWGVPEWDDRALFEKLVLDSFQAGLSWLVILRKREAFRVAFDNFNPEIIAYYDETQWERLMTNSGIVRNRAKIEATTQLARIWLDLAEKGGFARHLWQFVGNVPRNGLRQTLADVPTQSPESLAISRDLKSRGARFVGPVIIYAFMQAVGMVNDHLITCHRHRLCANLVDTCPW